MEKGVEIVHRNKSQRSCCVVGCENIKRKNPEIRFYSFPNRPWEVERKEKWITSVRRLTIDRKPWRPSKNSVICSAHFVGGEKSNDPRKESYNPTVFPPIYKKKPPNLAGAARLEARRKRIEAQNQIKSESRLRELDDEVDDSEEIDDSFETNRKITIAVGIQTDYYAAETSETASSTLFCRRNESDNEASTQTNILVNSNLYTSVKKIVVAPSKPLTKNARVGSDCSAGLGFIGFEDINDDIAMTEIGGITMSFFLVLLRFIEPGRCGQPKYFKTIDRENRLLLFLMKMKLGLNFSILSCLFKVSKTTVSNVFFTTLDNLLYHTKNWLIWPSKDSIRENMPSGFTSYPNCRAMIDCTELRCDSPPTAEQRVLMYSDYKCYLTLKYLIALSPCGEITFISKGYGGRVADDFIANDSGFIDLIESGDEILADRAFPQIESELLKRRCSLVIPPFDIEPRLKCEDVLGGYSNASPRIHIESAIQRVKIFKILDYVNVELFPCIDKIMYMACILANNKEPIVPVN